MCFPWPIAAGPYAFHVSHNHYDVMAFTTPGEGSLRYRQDSRRVSRGHEDVAVPKERASQPGHAIHLRALPFGGNRRSKGQTMAGTKCRGPHTAKVRTTLAHPS
jgi:hypothetical protein